MARITEKEVHQAAAELDAQGIKPTTSKIREKLGSGSFSTIQTYIATYEGTSTGAEITETPKELDGLLPAIWAKCWEIAQDKFDAERARFSANVNEYEKEIETLKSIIEEQDKEIEKHQITAGIDAETIGMLEVTCEALKEKNAYLKGVIDGKKEPAKKPATKPAKQKTLDQDIKAAQI